MAELMALLIAIPLAILCAVKSGSALDRFVTGLAFGKLSLPPFMVAILLIYLLRGELNCCRRPATCPSARTRSAICAAWCCRR